MAFCLDTVLYLCTKISLLFVQCNPKLLSSEVTDIEFCEIIQSRSNDIVKWTARAACTAVPFDYLSSLQPQQQ